MLDLLAPVARTMHEREGTTGGVAHG